MAEQGIWASIDGEKVAITPGQPLFELLRERGDVDPGAKDPVAMASINGRRADLYEPLTKAAGYYWDWDHAL